MVITYLVSLLPFPSLPDGQRGLHSLIVFFQYMEDKSASFPTMYSCGFRRFGCYVAAMHAPSNPLLRHVAPILALSLSLCAMLGCTDDGQKLENATVKIGCGRCQFHMAEAQGCPFAAEIDGQHYLIQGRVPEDHQSHAQDGICNMVREAKVSGTLRDGKLITTKLDLLPAQSVPETRQYTEEDVH